MIQISANDILSELLNPRNHYEGCYHTFFDEKNNYATSTCTGGKIQTSKQYGKKRKLVTVDCPECGGTGQTPTNTLLLLKQLKQLLDTL